VIMDFHIRLQHLIQIEYTSTPPLTAIRIVSQTNATAWWFFACCV